jgi:hypothetical protein
VPPTSEFRQTRATRCDRSVDSTVERFFSPCLRPLSRVRHTTRREGRVVRTREKRTRPRGRAHPAVARRARSHRPNRTPSRRARGRI